MNVEPVALLPVRLETRFTDGGTTLRVRIFPDDIHIDAHDTGVNEDERVAGQTYWQAVWPLAVGDPGIADAWSSSSGVSGPRRASWVADRPRPDQPRPGARRRTDVPRRRRAHRPAGAGADPADDLPRVRHSR